VISDFGDKGFPASAIPKRWNQIWPDKPFPSPEELFIEARSVRMIAARGGGGAGDGCGGGGDSANVKDPNFMTQQPCTATPMLMPTTIMVKKKVRLLKFLKWKCSGVAEFRVVKGVNVVFKRGTSCTDYCK
jgi:hypothetical protein